VFGGTGSTSHPRSDGHIVWPVNTADEIREFLTTRRARITPERAGLQRYGRQRRVSGLRREEVALLADISVEYYIRLERGNARGVSEEVLEAVSRALQLDEAEHAHLLDLVRVVNVERAPRRSSTAAPAVRPSIRRIVDAIATIPAFVHNGRLDLLYLNPLAEALYSEHLRDSIRPANSARFLFLDPRASQFYVNWETVAHDVVASLHGEAGRNPYDRGLADLVGLLSTRSPEFRVLWASHDVRFHRTGTKRFHHPLVGDLTLAFEALALPADPGLTLVTYSAEPGSPSEAGLRDLAEWSATRERLSTVDATPRT
jgi:transcriptional regulator with XRE-family HTH domain